MTNFDIREDAIVALNGEQIDAVSGGTFGLLGGLLGFKLSLISSIFGGSKGHGHGNNNCNPKPKPQPQPCNTCAPRC